MSKLIHQVDLYITLFFLSRFYLLFPHLGNIYIGDTENHRIRKVTISTGIITTFAGSEAGYSGDNGSATSAMLYYPNGIIIDSAGNLFLLYLLTFFYCVPR